MLEFYFLAAISGLLMLVILILIGLIAWYRDNEVAGAFVFALIFVGLGLVGSVKLTVDAAKRADQSMRK